MKAVRVIHPDKLNGTGVNLEDATMGKHLFTMLSAMYEEYRQRT